MEIAHQLGDKKIEIRIALAVRMRRHVDGHAVDFSRKIGPVVEVEGAQEILVRFPLARMLGHYQAGDILEHGARTQQRLACQLFLAHVACRGRLHIADAGRDDGHRVQACRARRITRVAGGCAAGIPGTESGRARAELRDSCSGQGQQPQAC